MTFVRKMLLSFLITPVLITGAVASNTAGSSYWQSCAQTILEATTFTDQMILLFSPALRDGVYDNTHAGEIVRIKRNEIYQKYASAMAISCGDRLAAIAQLDDAGTIAFRFSEDTTYGFIFDVEELFDYMPGQYGIMVWNDSTRSRESVIERATGRNSSPSSDAVGWIGFASGSNVRHRWWTKECSDHEVAWSGINRNSGVGTAARQAFGADFFGPNDKFLIDFPMGDNMRAFPGLLLVNVPGNITNSQSIVIYRNMKTGIQRAQSFAEALSRNNNSCSGQGLVVYLVSLTASNERADPRTGKIVWSTVGGYGGTAAVAGATVGIKAAAAGTATGAAAAWAGTAGGLVAVVTAPAWIIPAAIVTVGAGSIAIRRPSRITKDITKVAVIAGPFIVR